MTQAKKIKLFWWYLISPLIAIYANIFFTFYLSLHELINISASDIRIVILLTFIPALFLWINTLEDTTPPIPISVAVGILLPYIFLAIAYLITSFVDFEISPLNLKYLERVSYSSMALSLFMPCVITVYERGL